MTLHFWSAGGFCKPHAALACYPLQRTTRYTQIPHTRSRNHMLGCRPLLWATCNALAWPLPSRTFSSIPRVTPQELRPASRRLRSWRPSRAPSHPCLCRLSLPPRRCLPQGALARPQVGYTHFRCIYMWSYAIRDCRCSLSECLGLSQNLGSTHVLHTSNVMFQRV